MISHSTPSFFTRLRNPLEDAFLRFFSLRSGEIHFTGTMLAALLSCATFVLALDASQGGLADAFVLLQKRALVFGSEVFFIRILSVVFSVAVSLLVYKISVESRTSNHLRKAGVISVVLLNFALLLLSGGRGAVVTQTLVLLYVRNRGLNRDNFGFKSTLLIGGIGGLVLVGGMAMRRSAQLGIDLSEAIVDSITSAGHTISGAFPITDLYLSARHFANSTGHDYGVQFLLYFVRFIPRSLWEEKPFNLGYTIRDFYYGDTLAGAIPTVFGEFYIALGFIGIIVCGVFLGWMLSFLNRAYRYSLRDSQFALIYVLLAGLLIFDGLRAGLEMAVFMILYILITLTCFKLTSRRQARSSATYRPSWNFNSR